ncbi:MAG TPA: ThiF family adenylyltransferase [bacterium]
MNYSVAMTEGVNAVLLEHLARQDGDEDLCFALWRPSYGRTRTTALLYKVILPEIGDRAVHGNASFNPSYVERVLGEGLESGGGIAFLHSHPARGWQGLSRDDVRAERLLAPTVQGATSLPLVGMTVAARDGSWSARVWERKAPKQYRRVWAQSVRVVGVNLKSHFCDKVLKPPIHQPSQARTISAWGSDVQADIARLKFGIVGLGSVGSIIAEALARTGIQRILLLDYQTIEEVNLDRTLHASARDARRVRAKVEVAAKALRRSATACGFRVEAEELSVCEAEGYRSALDCDVIFSCVDRPWARSVLNFIAYAHLIPVIDGGIHVSRTNKGRLRGADWKAHVVGPDQRCLVCLGQYDPGLVAADQRGDFEDPGYLERLPDDHPAKANENVFGFSLGVASLEFMQLLMLTVAPLGLGPRAQSYHLLTGEIETGLTACEPGCFSQEFIASGEMHCPGTGVHAAAEAVRAERAARRHTKGGN